MMSEVWAVDVTRDWAMARDVQQGFMRGLDRAPIPLDHSARCRQVHDLGGDCYDFTPLGHNRLALTIGDASGKGLSAALKMANVQSSLRTAAFFAENDVAGVVKAVNRQVCASSLAQWYATLFYGVFDGATRTLRYTNAGHPPPMLVRRDSTVDWLETGGAPVGLLSDPGYEEGAVQLHPGDLLLAFTDGVTEAVNPAGEEWGVDGLRQAVTRCRGRSADDIVRAIFSSMDEFWQARLTDDATVLVLRVP